MPIPEIHDEEVEHVLRVLKDPATKVALVPAKRWVDLANHLQSNAQEIADSLGELGGLGGLGIEAIPAQKIAHEAGALAPEVEKLRQLVRDCRASAAKRGGTAEQFLRLMLAGYQLSQGLRLAAIDLWIESGLQG